MTADGTPRDTFAPGDSITDAGRGYPWTKNVDGTWWRVGQREPFTWEQVLAWHQAAIDNPDGETTGPFQPVLMVPADGTYSVARGRHDQHRAEVREAVFVAVRGKCVTDDAAKAATDEIMRLIQRRFPDVQPRPSAEHIESAARRAAQEPGDGSNLRWERATALAVILVGMGLPDPTVEQAARLIRWADAYEQGAVSRAAHAVAALFGPGGEPHE